jgi:hypothetical protein
MQKQLRTGESLRGKQLTKEKADELRRRLRFAKAVTQVAAQPIVEAVRSEARGVRQHMTDLAMGSVCLAPGTTPHDEYRANLLQIRQLQNRNLYLKETAPETKQRRRRAADQAENKAAEEAEGDRARSGGGRQKRHRTQELIGAATAAQS